MLFNSVDFIIFLPLVFILYWFIVYKSLKRQNFFVLIASYFFYGWWDWRFLSLIVFSTIIDYSIGVLLNKEEIQVRRNIFLWISLLINLGFLGFFKYYNFFLDNFITAFSFFGHNINRSSLNIILPVGISFYTFQTMSYTIDVYKKKIEPTTNIIAFAAFVSFFPQLVAGPIERASHLLPQFYKKRKFNYYQAIDGLRQILWGLFKKVVIADNCAQFADIIFNNSGDYSGGTLFLGAIFFAFQIYGDFSGYSDIAIGVSRLFGFDLKQNFAFPYFSRDIAEFWRRWHISLSTWFRDYLYIPLGGSKGGLLAKVRNTFVIFLVSGFWHGANWTFIAWGFLNALYFLPLLLTNRNRKNLDIVGEGKNTTSIKEYFYILKTFILTVIAWVFFRADNINHAFSYLKSMISLKIFNIDTSILVMSASTIILIIIFLIIEWLGKENQYAIEKFGSTWKKSIRLMFYYTLVIAIFWYGGKEQQFIYFQF